MLSVIIPCISASQALNTIRSFQQVAHKQQRKIQFIVVVDGADETKTKTTKGITFRYLEGVRGSYAARNEGARFADYDQLLFLDSDVEILHLPNIDIADAQNVLLGSIVRFDRTPRDEAGRWYYNNAFKQAEFIQKYRFLPTIALFVSRRVFDALNGFDERFVSGGDVDFGHRATAVGFELRLEERFEVRTRLRTANQVVKKVERQSYGQVYEMINSNAHWRLIVSLRVAKNFALWLRSLVLGFARSRDFSAARIYACRCRILTASIFLSVDQITRRATLANLSEVNIERRF